jgi:hypothetical protein
LPPCQISSPDITISSLGNRTMNKWSNDSSQSLTEKIVLKEKGLYRAKGQVFNHTIKRTTLTKQMKSKQTTTPTRGQGLSYILCFFFVSSDAYPTYHGVIRLPPCLFSHTSYLQDLFDTIDSSSSFIPPTKCTTS